MEVVVVLEPQVCVHTLSVSLCLSLSMSVSVSVCLTVSLSLCLSLSVCLSVAVSLCLSESQLVFCFRLRVCPKAGCVIYIVKQHMYVI